MKNQRQTPLPKADGENSALAPLQGTFSKTRQEGKEGIHRNFWLNLFPHMLLFLPKAPAAVLCSERTPADLIALLVKEGYETMDSSPLTSKGVDEHEVLVEMEGGQDIQGASSGPVSSTRHARGHDVVLLLEALRGEVTLARTIDTARSLLRNDGFLVIVECVSHDYFTADREGMPHSADILVALAESGFRIQEHRAVPVGMISSPSCEEQRAPLGSADETGQMPHLQPVDMKNLRTSFEPGQLVYEIFVARKDAFSVKAYKSGDEDKILRLFIEIFGTPRTMDHWRWKFRDNPYGCFKIAEAFSSEGGLVGHYAGYPVPFYSCFEGLGSFLSYQIGDTMTSPAGRKVGLGRTSILARTANYFYAKFCRDVPFIYGFNTGKIRKLGMRYLSYEYLDPVVLWSKELPGEGRRPTHALERLIKGYAVEEMQSVGTEWDTFFERVRSSYKFLVQRDRRYITWRYLDCPDRVHRVFAIVKRGRLIGWSVFVRRDARLMWGDALFEENCDDAVSFLLDRVVQKHFQGIKRIEGWFSSNPSWWIETIKRQGFSPSQEPNDLAPAFAIFGNESLMEKLKDTFYYTLSDSDLF